MSNVQNATPPIRPPRRPKSAETLAALPTFSQVLTGETGCVALSSPALRADLIAMDTGKPSCVIAVNRDKADQLHMSLANLRQRLKEAGYDDCEIYFVPTPVISDAYTAAEALVGPEMNDGGLSDEDTSRARKVLAQLAGEAVKARASDIHIVIAKKANRATITFRINGHVRPRAEWKADYTQRVMRAIWETLAEEKHDLVDSTGFNRSTPQDASIRLPLPSGGLVMLRYAHSPMSDGLDVVFRILNADASNELLPLETLGYTTRQAGMLMYLIKREGLLVIAGITGSGKSTLMRHLIEHYARESRDDGSLPRVLTIESPVEYIIPGASQTALSKGLSYADGVRSMMRRDPDLLMVGETRDRDTAETVKDAVLTGHPVITSLHASSSIGVVARLEGLGIPRSVMTSPNFLAGVVFQRLVPVLCPHCSIPLAKAIEEGLISEGLKTRIHAAAHDTTGIRVQGRGCAHCCPGFDDPNPETESASVPGFIGRTACAEMMMFDRFSLRHIADQDDHAALQHWKDNAGLNGADYGWSALQHAIHKMERGEVCPLSIESEFTSLYTDTAMADGKLTVEELDRLFNA